MIRSYLVTGGAGFIGSHLCEELVAQGNRVTILDNMSSGNTRNIESFKDRVHLIEGDIRQLDSVSASIPDVDVVIHLAALISGYDSLSDPDSYMDVNVAGTLRVIDFAIERKIPRIVFASSSTIYGNTVDGLIGEDALPRPMTVYALTKLAGEHLLDLYAKMHGFTHCSLRLFNVYGPRQAEDHPYANVTCKFSHAAVHSLPVKLYGDGLQSRDFIYVDDVVKAFLAVLHGSDQAIYNVGTGQDRSIRDLLQLLGGITGQPLAVEQCPPWSNDIRRIRAEVDRFATEFGFRPSFPLEDGLRATTAYFEEQRRRGGV